MKKYLFGVISGILLSGLFYGIYTLSSMVRAVARAVEEGPSGGGSFLISPDETMIAHINNVYADEAKGLPPYYEFKVSIKNQHIIRSRRIRVEGVPLDFRRGTAENWIKWNADSRSVTFVHDDDELWREDSLPETPEAEQAGADQPATVPQLKSEDKKNTNPQLEARPR